MADTSAITFALSALPKLEPLAGVAFALNVAYLNLRRWRYREDVKQIADDALDALQRQKNANSTVGALDQFIGLSVLAGTSTDLNEQPTFIVVFHHLYTAEWDVRLSFVFTLLSALILCGGVAHGLELGKWSLVFGTVPIAQGMFWVLVAALAAPGLFVLTGRWLAKRAKKFAAKCQAQLASIFEDKIDEVILPIRPRRTPGPKTSD